MNLTRRWGLWTAGLLAIVANVLSVIQFGFANAWLYGLVAAASVLALIWFAARNVPTFWAVRRLLAEAEAELFRLHLSPRRIIAFDRSSGVFGGMLCQRLGIAELMVLPRRAESRDGSRPREIIVGDFVQVDAEKLATEAMVFVYHLRTGGTLEAGLRSLGESGHTIPVLALYATEGAKAQWPGAIVVKTVKNGYVPNEHLPWMSSPYAHS